MSLMQLEAVIQVHKQGFKSHCVGQRLTGVVVSHLEDFEVVLRFFYQVSDGKVHSLSVPEQHERKQREKHQLKNSEESVVWRQEWCRGKALRNINTKTLQRLVFCLY